MLEQLERNLRDDLRAARVGRTGRSTHDPPPMTSLRGAPVWITRATSPEVPDSADSAAIHVRQKAPCDEEQVAIAGSPTP